MIVDPEHEPQRRVVERGGERVTHALRRRELGELQHQAAHSLAQEKYYSSYSKAAPVHRTVPAQHDSSPWPALAIGLGLIVLAAGAVAVAVRTRRRTMRVAV